MAILTDFHTHSHFSGDCNTPMEDMITQAISLGMTHLCFTEHFDPDYPINPDDPLDFSLNTLNYRDNYLTFKEKYRHNIQLLWGVELGLQSHLYGKLKQYTSEHPFDFIIASSHLCNGEDPYYPAFFERKEETTVYGEYFSSILENVKNYQDFDIYGHLDYIVRYGPNKDTRYTYEAYRDIFDEILKILIQNGKGIELNTGGVKYGLKDLHPATAILKRYRELSGEIITIGSDAHAPVYLQNHFFRAEEVLKSCGFQYYTIFEKRKPEFIRL